MIVNVGGRTDIVNYYSKWLINRLNEGTLRQTILNTRLQQLPNVIITPHIAYNTKEAVNRILETVMSNINSFIEGVVDNNVN